MTMESLSDTRCSGGGGDVVGEAGSELAAAPSTPTMAASPATSCGMLQDDEDDDEQLDDGASSSNAPTSREMRNRAEKQRRDKLNTYINELAKINPYISESNKKMDKTSVLRLSAALMRLHKYQDALVQEQGTCCTPTSALSQDGLAAIKEEQLFSPVSSATPGGSLVPVGEATSSRLIYNGELPIPDNLTDHMLENMNWFLMLVSANGKIVFISTSISKILGHSQKDLLGQSLFNITCPTDHDTLRKNLQLNVDESEPSTSNTPDHLNQRKNFFLKLSQKSTSRSDISQYEIFQITGHLKVLGGGGNNNVDAQSTQICRKSTARRDSGAQPSHSQPDVVLIAIAKMAGLRSFNLVQMDASQEEYFTRHSLEGDIVYCDQRISVAAGYMAEEVYGMSAFRFMHHEDVGWCLVSLRQMYSKGGGFGTSTYRLQNKMGEFIFLRTHGHLEYDKETNKPISFICVNTLLSKSEGWKGLSAMKDRFSAKVEAKNLEAIMPKEVEERRDDDEDIKKVKKESALTMDYKKLEKMISNHLCNITPTLKTANDEVPDPEYLKCVAASKQLPPPMTNLSMVKRRQSISSHSPQQNPLSPPSPLTPKAATPAYLKCASPPTPSPPEPQQAESTQVVASKGRTARVRRREHELPPDSSDNSKTKHSRRGRPRGSTGLKRKAKLEAATTTAPKRSPELTIYKTDDAPLPCLPPLDSDALEWMDSSTSMLFDSHPGLFEVPLGEDNAELTSIMLGDFAESTKTEDFLLASSPLHPELPFHHQNASKLLTNESTVETTTGLRAIHHVEGHKESPPEMGV